ncbi:MAG: hypothetical protein HQL21_01540 [Candidatus Omnitrophica bacterium]|nr:hypothetical protein [Candidatus Omnitrophota bacterium]
MKKIVSLFTLVIFLWTSLVPSVRAQGTILSEPVPLAPVISAYGPCVLKGMRVHVDDPFRLDFLIDSGSQKDAATVAQETVSRQVRYFLAALTMPQREQWVNLSPIERDRIIPDAFALTEMGRDLLEQDSRLKELAASLMDPRKETGRRLWDVVYKRFREKFGDTDIPVDTFNKVWIVPDRAVVEENNDTVVIKESRLKVLLEADYLALEKNQGAAHQDKGVTDQALIMRDEARRVLLPIIEEEVNTGERFSALRQVYNALILAVWYKEALRERLLNRNYVDREKVTGIDMVDQGEKQAIYEKYVDLFNKGAFNFIQEEEDPLTREVLPRKYFSGGMNFESAMISLTRVKRLALTTVVVGTALWAVITLVNIGLNTLDHSSRKTLPPKTAVSQEQQEFNRRFDAALVRMSHDSEAFNYMVGLLQNTRNPEHLRGPAFKALALVAMNRSGKVIGVSGKALDVNAGIDEIRSMALLHVAGILRLNDPFYFKDAPRHIVEYINYLHDHAPASHPQIEDEIRMGMNVSSLFLFLSQSEGLYSSTFQKFYFDFWERFTSLRSRYPGTWLQLEEGGKKYFEEAYFPAYAANVSMRGFFADLMVMPNVFVHALPMVAHDLKKLVMLSPGIEDILSGQIRVTPAFQAEVASLLLDSYGKNKARDTQSVRALGIFLRLNQSKFPAQHREWIARYVPEIPAEKIRKAQAISYPSGDIQGLISFDPSAQAYMPLLADALRANTDRGRYTVRPLSNGAGFVAEKGVAGRTIRVYLGKTRAVKDMIRSGQLDLRRVNFISTRSHSYEMMEALEGILGPASDWAGIYLPGACGSLSHRLELLGQHPKMKAILRSDTDEGFQVNQDIVRVLDGMGRQVGDWETMQRSVPRRQTPPLLLSILMDQERSGKTGGAEQAMAQPADAESAMKKNPVGGIDMDRSLLSLEVQGRLKDRGWTVLPNDTINALQGLSPVVVDLKAIDAQAFFSGSR